MSEPDWEQIELDRRRREAMQAVEDIAREINRLVLLYGSHQQALRAVNDAVEALIRGTADDADNAIAAELLGASEMIQKGVSGLMNARAECRAISQF